MKTLILTISFIITSTFVDAQELGDPNCDSLLLVSSWTRDNVKIYDGCDGAYIRDLAEDGVLDGPQAIFQDGNGDVIVVSESNHRLIKFDQETLTTATTVVSPGLMQNPITVINKDDGNIYLGSYSSNQIIELNTTTWQAIRTILPANNGQIQGIDIGMALGPDGQVYVPGYDSDNILRVDPTSSTTNQFVQSGNNNLDRPRSILFLDDRMLVTAWGNQAIYSYSLTGQFQGTPVTGLIGPSGMIQDGPDHILVTSDRLNTVRRYKLSDFSFETIIPDRSGGLTGATFVYRMQKTSSTVPISGMRQAWLSGVGEINGDQLLVSEFTTTGGQFGDSFNPADITTVYWGDLLFEFVDCHRATMSYQSQLEVEGVGFGTGSYDISRLAMNPTGANCDSMGFDQVADKSYMTGVFTGGVDRDGEGFTIDYLNENQAIVTWFTYLPESH